MNYNEDKKGKQSNGKHSPLKHMLHMAICCGLPITILFSLPLIIKASPSIGSVVLRILPFICPVMMIFMIPMMMRGSKKGSCCDNTNEDKKTLEVK
ncbi:hypothetical protein [Clostridium lacusfryxellense]|uniref:hypothetical protein n=1 Tax=Clostridium lacusfryxellense TaxID=205328 RepID=UPI001C0E4014|nr:hypothetical protein [Clostridium lacusfryxellense]MBU3114848.1 hypothetical protein [Clostridium lacusfryxellense]